MIYYIVDFVGNEIARGSENENNQIRKCYIAKYLLAFELCTYDYYYCLIICSQS